MTRKTFLPLLFPLLISCSQQSKNGDDIYIVPVRHKPNVSTKPNEPPPPPPIQVYYLPANFIIDSNGQVRFYVYQEPSFICGTDMDWDTPPELIHLKPTELVLVPLDAIASFTKLNLLGFDSKDRRVAIASAKDTIQSPALSLLFKVLNDTSYKITWTFRKTTQEENIVLNFRKNNRKYDPDYAKWDSTKTGFPPALVKNRKFIPPKIKEY
jgi:hypothetical protein